MTYRMPDNRRKVKHGTEKSLKAYLIAREISLRYIHEPQPNPQGGRRFPLLMVELIRHYAVLYNYRHCLQIGALLHFQLTRGPDDGAFPVRF